MGSTLLTFDYNKIIKSGQILHNRPCSSTWEKMYALHDPCCLIRSYSVMLVRHAWLKTDFNLAQPYTGRISHQNWVSEGVPEQVM